MTPAAEAGSYPCSKPQPFQGLVSPDAILSDPCPLCRRRGSSKDCTIMGWFLRCGGMPFCASVASATTSAARHQRPHALGHQVLLLIYPSRLRTLSLQRPGVGGGAVVAAMDARLRSCGVDGSRFRRLGSISSNSSIRRSIEIKVHGPGYVIICAF